MKKIYSLFVIAMIALFSFNASANNITATIKADPNYIKAVYLGGGTTPANSNEVSFSEEGVTSTVSANSWYFYLIVETIDESKWNAQITSATGTVSKISSTISGRYGSSMINSNTMNNCVIEIFSASNAPKDYIYVTIDGDPSKVSMDFQGSVVPDLALGENKVELKSTAVNFKAIGGDKFYKMERNGVEKKPSEDATGATIIYNYLFTGVKANDRFYIDTENPIQSQSVTIDCGDYPDFVTTVKVNDVAIDDWSDLTVNYGDKVRVETDFSNYFVNSVTINGVAPDGFTGAIEKFVEEDMVFAFDVAPIVRDQELTVIVPDQLSLDVYNTVNANLISKSSSGTYTFNYDKNEMPLVVFSEPTGSSELTDVRVAYLNGDRIAQSFYSLKLTEDMVNSGDELEIKLETPAFKVIAEDAEHIVMTLYGTETAINSGADIKIKDGQDDSSITFRAAEGYEITSFKYNGVDKTDEADNGVYSIYPIIYDEVEIEVAEKIHTITVNVSDAAAFPYGVMVGEDFFELEDGENVIDLNECESTDMVAIFVDVINFAISEFLYNGEDITGDEEYFMDGAYCFYSFNPGDTFSVSTVAKVRDQKLVVYTSGLDNFNNPYIAEVTGSVALHDEPLAEGYNHLYFHNDDNPIFFHADMLSSGSVYVYLNDELIESRNTYFEANVAHNDVLKIYVQEDAPEAVELEFALRGGLAAPVVEVDHVKTVNLVSRAKAQSYDGEPEPDCFFHSVLPGTHVSISAPAGETYNQVFVNDNLVEPVDGKASFTIGETAPSIRIYAGTQTTGIENVEINNAAAAKSVYNLQGIRVNGNNLPAGVYIINGKKVLVK